MHSHSAHQPDRKETIDMYKKLALMVFLSVCAMYVLMYAMVDRLENVVPNINQFYMAGLMAMPMLLIEIILMWKMYPRKDWNWVILSFGIVGTILFYVGVREQAGVGDAQFLKSMIPHHGAAVLMVEKTELHDPEIKALADGIIKAQQAEIAQMKAKLKELGQ